MRLITIPLSHYCERARWALDRCGVEYVEEQHLQMFHRPALRRVGGGRTVPALVTPDGTLTDSADIVTFADARAAAGRRLYPTDAGARDEALELERAFAEELGVESRRWAYFRLLPLRRVLLRYNDGDASKLERIGIRIGFPLAKGLITSYYGLTEENVRAGLEKIRRHLDAVAGRLADGRPFLTGDRFTAADLTFAAMAAPLLLPEHYGVPMPPLDELPAALAEEIRGFRDHPGGAFALRLFREERRARPA